MVSPEPISGLISSTTITSHGCWRDSAASIPEPPIRGRALPADNGGINKVPGDWHETMSTHWFHDHMFTFTDQNVYKCNAGMNNIYSSLDRGNESINDGVNLRMPSGTSKSWGNLDFDVNLMLADKAWDPTVSSTMDTIEL